MWVMEESAQAEKQAKREAKVLRDQARAAFAAGDFAQTRELDLKIVGLTANSDLGKEAATQAQNLRPDPYAIYFGLGALAVYAIAWVFALV